MNVRLEELIELPLSERLQLVEDLWESIAVDLEALPLLESLRTEMDARVADPSRSLSLEEVQRRMKAGD